MAAIKKSYEQISQFDSGARQYLARKEQLWKQDEANKNKSYPGSKWTYGINRVLKRCQSLLSHYREEVERITIENASTDKEGDLITDERGQFKFKPAALAKRNKEQYDLFRSETEIEPYYPPVDSIPPDLTDDEKDLFADFVLKPEGET